MTLSKITRPGYPAVYPRRGLFRALDKLRRRPAVWIAAAPGSGKTTLVSSYVASRRLSSLWYQVDGGDADPATFFHYLGLAAKKAAPRRAPLPPLTPEHLPSLPIFSRRWFEALFARMKPPACLVFDNVQEAPADSPFFEILRQGIDAAPEGIALLFISRGAPPALFAKLEADQRIEALSPSEIPLTRREAFAFMRLRSKGRLSQRLMEQIFEQSGGWPAGIILLLKTAEGGGAIQNVSSDALFDYFASEIFKRLDEGTRSFLMETSLFPSMDAAAAEGQSGRGDAGRILSELARSHCFTERRSPHSRPVYQYHPLFREFLLSRLRQERSAEEIDRLRGRAAALLEGADQTEEAFALYRDANDSAGMARMVMRHAKSLLGQARYAVLAQWIGAIPADEVKKDPWLLYWLGVCRTPFHPDEAYRRSEEAFLLFRSAKDRIGTFLAWAGAVNARVFLMRRFSDLDRWMALLDDLEAEFGEIPAEVEAVVVPSIVAALNFRRPDDPRFIYWSDQILRHLDAANPMTQIHSLHFIVLGKQAVGDFIGSRILIDRFRQIVDSTSLSPLAALTAYWQESVYFTMSGEAEACQKVVQKGLDLAESSGVHLFDMMLLGHGALCAFNAGDLKRGAQLLEKMEPALGRFRLFDQSFYYYIRCHEAALKGRFAEALSFSDIASGMAGEIEFPLTAALIDLQKAFVLKKLKRDEEAESYLREGHRAVERGFKYIEFLYRIIESFFAFEAERDEEGAASLKKALAVVRETPFLPVYIWIPEMMEKIALRALDLGVEVDAIKALIKQRKIVPRSVPFPPERWPRPVKLFTLGRFDLFREERPVPLTGKSGKPLDLLKLLISLGGRSVPQEQVTDLLWPDADGDSAYRALITNLHRLRKLIGQETVSFLDGRLNLNADDCWVDLWALERSLGRAEEMIREGGYTEEAVRLIEKGAALYKGPFLPEEEGKPWTVAPRERLRERLLRSLGEAGSHFEREGMYERAALFFKRALEIDPAAEALCRRLMTCFGRMGLKCETAAAYGRFKKAISERLGLSPSAETEALYQTIIAE